MPLPQSPENVLTISDFSAGIYSNGAGASTVPPAPLGAAQETNTHSCIALPGGGLGPLPVCNTWESVPSAWPASLDGQTTLTCIAGIGRQYDLNARGLFHSSLGRYYMWDFGFPWIHRNWYQINPVLEFGYATGFTFPYGVDLNTGKTNANASNAIFDAPYPASHILAGKLWLPTDPKNRYFEIRTGDPVPVSRMRGAETSEAEGIAFLFQQRDNWLTGIPDAQTILYTKTGEVALNGSLQLYGFMSGDTYGVISTGELLLISRGQGALRISGALEYPTVTELPGVVGTGLESMRAVPSSIGLLYCVHGKGVFVWNGSNTSSFVSPQLRPDFFQRPTRTTDESGGQSVQATKWMNYAVFPNNFLFDPEQGSWWRLGTAAADRAPSAALNGAVFWTDQWGDLWAMPDTITRGVIGNMKWLAGRIYLSNIYSWQSHPLPVGGHGKMVVVDDIELRVVPSAAGVQQTVTITLTPSVGPNVVETFTFTSNATKPLRLRKTTSCRGYDIIVRIEANGNANPAPVVHGLSLGWRETAWTDATHTDTLPASGPGSTGYGGIPA